MLLYVYLYLYCLNSYSIISNLEGSQLEYKTEFGLGEGMPRRLVELCHVCNSFVKWKTQIPLHTNSTAHKFHCTQIPLHTNSTFHCTHTVNYHTVNYHTVNYHTVNYHTVNYHTVNYHTCSKVCRISTQCKLMNLIAGNQPITITLCLLNSFSLSELLLYE